MFLKQYARGRILLLKSFHEKRSKKIIDDMIYRGVASNKSDLVRQALYKFAEDQAVEVVLRAEQELKEGKTLRGDLRKIAAKIP